MKRWRHQSKYSFMYRFMQSSARRNANAVLMTAKSHSIPFSRAADTPKFKIFRSDLPFKLTVNNASLPSVVTAYETWGTLNKERDNAILLHTGFLNSVV